MSRCLKALLATEHPYFIHTAPHLLCDWRVVDKQVSVGALDLGYANTDVM